MHTRTHGHTHARTHEHAHAHTRTDVLIIIRRPGHFLPITSFHNLDTLCDIVQIGTKLNNDPHHS